MSNVSTCLWFGKDAEAAVRFYVSLLPGSRLEQVGASAGWRGEDGRVSASGANHAGQRRSHRIREERASDVAGIEHVRVAQVAGHLDPARRAHDASHGSSSASLTICAGQIGGGPRRHRGTAVALNSVHRGLESLALRFHAIYLRTDGSTSTLVEWCVSKTFWQRRKPPLTGGSGRTARCPPPPSRCPNVASTPFAWEAPIVGGLSAFGRAIVSFAFCSRSASPRSSTAQHSLWRASET
ncbi:MAG: VOC family protein [Alphaproteobacteria bacterium]|nr:VOC family protein [Alphaproteobacteria bacterium]